MARHWPNMLQYEVQYKGQCPVHCQGQFECNENEGAMKTATAKIKIKVKMNFLDNKCTKPSESRYN